MIRIVLIDDESASRAGIAQLLRESRFEVAAAVPSTGDSIGVVREQAPHLIVISATVVRAEALTRELMIAAPRPVVVVMGTRHPASEEISMRVLAAGALAFLSAPIEGSGADEGAKGRFAATLDALSQVRVVRQWAPRSPVVKNRGAQRFRVVVLAASTGGPKAVSTVLAGLPTTFAAPILLVQHMALGFLPGFVEWLNQQTPLRVQVAKPGDALLPGNVYVAPEDAHLGVTSSMTVLVESSPPVGGFRPAATFLFDSAARELGNATLALVLTGMGSDGAPGAQAIHGAGGFVIAQDESTSVVFGMPAAAIERGCADEILPLDEIAGRLVHWVGHTE